MGMGDRCAGAGADTYAWRTKPSISAATAWAEDRAGDVLVVWKLDRLGRTMKGLVDLAAELVRGDPQSGEDQREDRRDIGERHRLCHRQ